MRDITAGRPKHIIVERQEHGGRPLWKFVLLTESEDVLDYSFCSTRGMAWRMAKRSWRRAERLSKEHDHG